MELFNPNHPENPNHWNQNGASLSYQVMLSEGVIDQIATIYDTEEASRTLLDMIGFPPSYRPPWNTPAVFWQTICREIENGRIKDGSLENLLRVILKQYPGANFFTNFLTASQSNVELASSQGFNLYISGTSSEAFNLLELMEQIRSLAQQNQIYEQVELSFSVNGLTAFFLENGSLEQALTLRDAITSSTLVQDGQVEVALGREGSQDYLYRNIYVQGPDQGRFQFSNVPASTTIRELGSATVDTQYESTWPRDHQNQPRNVVVDHITAEGTEVRISSPDTSLDDNDIAEGDTLQVNPESKAASVNQIIRQQALVRAKAQVSEFISSNPDVKVEANNPRQPTHYILQFKANSWAPPARVHLMPIKREEHEVGIYLTNNFPMIAPIVLWLTPIFHPNIQPNKQQKVCLGELEDRYRPGLHFGKLCKTIIDIAAYRNYWVDSSYNKAAAHWAKSEEGQKQIVQAGGIAINQSNPNNAKIRNGSYLKINLL